MALQQIQKSSTFKPDMIGDVVEVTMYDTSDGSSAAATGVLRAYSTVGSTLVAEFEGDRDVPAIKIADTSQVNISITHYEFVLDLTSIEEDGE